MHLDIRASLNPKDEKYGESYERMFGWRCFYCRQDGESIITKEDACPRCKRNKDDAKV